MKSSSLWLIAILILATTFPTWSQEKRLTSSQLRAKGIETAQLQPITFSHDDRTLAAFDRAPFEEKKKGTFYRLWFFELRRDGSVGDVRSVDLPLKSLLQGEFTPDDSQFVVLGDRGTTFLTVDLSSLEVRPLMEPTWGVPGFRADPAVLWTEAGRLFVTGVPYDKERFVETSTVATVNPDKTGRAAFQRNKDISTVEKSLERLWFANYVTDSAAFFAQKYPQVSLLSYWNGDEVREIDRAWKFSGFWGNAGRLLYSAKETEFAEFELTLFDSKSGSSNIIDTSQDKYSYLFLSRDGETLLMSHLAEGRRLIPYFAKESQEWDLKPLAGVDSQGNPRSVAAGWMRLSSTGKFVSHIGSTGMTIYPLLSE